MTGLDPILALWPYPATMLYLVISLVTSGHAALRKRGTRAAIGWVGAIWLAPILGTLLYVWLRINRIERRARELRTKRPPPGPPAGLRECSADELDLALGPDGMHLKSLLRLVGARRDPAAIGCAEPRHADGGRRRRLPTGR